MCWIHMVQDKVQWIVTKFVTNFRIPQSVGKFLASYES